MSVTTLSSDMLLLLNLTDGCFMGRLMRVTALSIDSIYVAVVKSH